MYSVEGSKRMNYYVPLQNDETPPFKKKHTNVSPARRAIRILGRRYALTATGYKFLEIGINVGSPSYVEIVIEDNRGNELILSLETWKGLLEQRENIQACLWNHRKDNSINVGPLTVRFTATNGIKLIHLESADVRLAMTEPTLLTMFNLDRCVDLTFEYLNALVETVDAKYARFSNIAASVTTETNDVSNAICASDYFDRNQLLDCELLTLVFNKM